MGLNMTNIKKEYDADKVANSINHTVKELTTEILKRGLVTTDDIKAEIKHNGTSYCVNIYRNILTHAMANKGLFRSGFLQDDLDTTIVELLLPYVDVSETTLLAVKSLASDDLFEQWVTSLLLTTITKTIMEDSVALISYVCMERLENDA